MIDFELENVPTCHSQVTTACAPERAFRIEVICAIPTPVAKVMIDLRLHVQTQKIWS